MAEELSEMVEGILPAGPIPLTAVQIEAARQLHDGYMPGWNASGAVLDVLRDARPGFDPGTVWLKVSALSALYGPLGLAAYTNLSAAVNCTVEVMSTSPAASAATVNAIEDAMGGDAIDAYRPFASKFVHFFVPSYGAVPIYDRWARERLDYHLLGPDELGYVPDTYAEFLGKIVSLQTSVSPAPSFRELDWYLWLAGHYAAWTPEASTHGPKELAEIAGDPEVQALLALLCPDQAPTSELM